MVNLFIPTQKMSTSRNESIYTMRPKVIKEMYNICRESKESQGVARGNWSCYIVWCVYIASNKISIWEMPSRFFFFCKKLPSIATLLTMIDCYHGYICIGNVYWENMLCVVRWLYRYIWKRTKCIEVAETSAMDVYIHTAFVAGARSYKTRCTERAGHCGVKMCVCNRPFVHW